MSLTAGNLLELIGADETDHFAVGVAHDAKPTPLHQVDAAINALPKTSNLYFSINPTTSRSTKGTEEQTSRWLALNADLDGEENKLGTIENCEQVMADLSGILGVGPTAVIYSGHGIQPVWSLEDTGALTNDEQQALLKRWGRLVQRVASHRGSADSVFNLDRLHRAPGTMNVKRVPHVEAFAVASGGAPIGADRLVEILNDYDIPETETVETGEAERAGVWTFADKTCGYVASMVSGWETDEPTTSRHAWMLSQCVRLNAAHRYGCISEADHGAAFDVLRSRFLQLLKQAPARSPQPANELGAAWLAAVARVEVKTQEALAGELGNHPHREDIADAIYDTTVELRYIRDLARAQMLSPDAVLLAALAFVLSATRYDITIPAFINSRAVLNFYAGLVGDSGVGKTGAYTVALEMFSIAAKALVPIRNPSSGEGIAAMFREAKPAAAIKAEQEENPTRSVDPEQWVTHNVLSLVDEITELAAQGGRSGSTLLSNLRKAFSGVELGSWAADSTRRRSVPAKMYRFCMVVGVQFATADLLLREEGEGTPQRFAWAPATDPNASLDVEHPGRSPFLSWTPPRGIGPGEITYPEQVRGIVRLGQLRRARHEPDAPDGHITLVRLKVAAALAVLHGTTVVDEQMWMISGLVMENSNRVLAEMKAHGAKANESAAKARGKTIAVTQEATARSHLERIKNRVVKYVIAAGTEGLTISQIRKKLPQDKKAAPAAIDLAIEGGYVVKEMREKLNRPDADKVAHFIAGKTKL